MTWLNGPVACTIRLLNSETGNRRSVTGSGDLEVMFTKKDLGGKVQAKVCTPVKGFDAVWEKMLGKFVNDTGVGNIVIEINDDNATPIVVYMRLRQALEEATAKEAE